MRAHRIVLAAGLGVGVVLGIAWQFRPREMRACTACTGTGAVSCGAAGCMNGRVPCPFPCLKREDPNWQVSTNPRFGPNTLTLKFYDTDGSYVEVSQGHIGQVMLMENGRWSLGPPCGSCSGSTRILCPACRGKKACPAYKGKGEVPT